MIITVTLNASIDKAYYISQNLEDFTVMRVDRCINTAGGKGLNVARSIKLCGEKVLATGFIGGYNGKYLISLLETDGINNDFVEVKGETRSCINIIDKDKRSTEFLEPGFELNIDDENAFINRFIDLISHCDVVTLSGSIPKGLSKDIYQKLIKTAADKGIRTILDSSGKTLVGSLEACPTLIKPNKEELEKVLSIEIKSDEDMVSVADMLIKKGIRYVVISLGEKGAFISDGRTAYIAKAKNIEAINPVGSGDCMVGALAVALKKHMDIKEMICFAVAVGSANAADERTGHFDLNNVKQIKENIEIRCIGGDNDAVGKF